MVQLAQLLLHLVSRRPRSHAGDQALIAVDAHLLAVRQLVGTVDSCHHGRDAIFARYDGRMRSRPPLSTTTATIHWKSGVQEAEDNHGCREFGLRRTVPETGQQIVSGSHDDEPGKHELLVATCAGDEPPDEDADHYRGGQQRDE
jgi:hypothetical protein